MKKIIISGVLLLAAAAMADIRALTPVPQNADPKSWWMQRFRQKQAERAAFATNGAPKVVFIGDSITHFWETNGKSVWGRYFAGSTFKAYNLGYSADRTEHVLWRLDNGELDGYETKAVVLMIGTNNSGHFPLAKETPADTVAGIRAILDKIREKQPKAKILLCAIFPRGRDERDGYRVRNEAVNRVISGFCDGRTIVWCDFTRRMLRADGVLPIGFMPDCLHPGAAGYEVWANAIMPPLKEMLRGDYVITGVLPEVLPETYFAAEGPLTTVGQYKYTPYSSSRGTWWWTKRNASRRELISKSDGKFDLVLMGDSIMHFWEDKPANSAAWAALTNQVSTLNCGYAGDHVENLIWRCENGELDGYTAKTVVLMIGTNNNSADRSRPADVAAGVKRAIAVIRQKQPQARIVLHPIFPRGFGPAAYKPGQDRHTAADKRNKETNKLLEKLADGKDVIWLDFNAKLVDPATGWTTKAIMGDGIHPSDAGYRIWMEALQPYIAGKK